MDFLTINNLGLFTLLFLPGFISVKVHSLLVANERYDFSKNLFEIIAYSLLNIVLFSWLIALNIYFDWLFERSWSFFISVFIILIVGPIIWPIALKKLLGLRWARKYIVSDTKSAWDFYFGQRIGVWVILHLKDGRRIGGRFGAKSFASPYPCPESLYIQELWRLNKDGSFESKIENTNGILIKGEEISLLEFKR